MNILPLLVLATFAVAQDAPNPAPPKPEVKAPAFPIADAYMSQYTQLLQQLRIMELQLCADVGLHYRVCEVDWAKRTVNPKPRQATAQPAAATETPKP